ncbi:tape measure protein [Lysinibacillus sp. NPDC096418]|uniref:tape measure protein n=1 Tax=Lysinibacillus sp. NPDC096418 TaxID=3364138 RepID=UPI003817D60A
MAVNTTMTLTDRVTNTLNKMMKSMNSTIRAMEQMHTASSSSMDMRSLQRARRDIESANASFDRLRASARQAGSEGQNVGNRLRSGFSGASAGADAATSSVRRLLVSFTGFAAAYLSIQGIANGFNKFTQASDNYSNSNARLNNVNDGLQTQAQLQDKIYKASQRSLSSYNDTAASVAKLNLLAKDAFGSNDEAIRFTELMNKSFSVSGASTQEKQAGMYQLTQAMAAGRLQGDEFRSIMENAPLLAQAIADSTGVGMDGLKKMSSEGTITANIIKSALFGAAKDIEDKFNSMPLTFADAMTVFNNWAQKAFEPMFIRFRQFVNSDAFGVLAGHAMIFVNLFISGLSLVFDTLEKVYNGVASFGDMLQNTWALIGPVILTATAALSSYLAILLVYRGVMMVVAAYEAARTFALGVMAAASMLATGATLAQTAAVWGLNMALLAFPGTWILIAFIAVIAIVVNAMIMWEEQTAEVIGAIVGGISWLGAAFYNVLIGVANLAITVAEWFVNTWNQAIYFAQLAWIAFNLMVRIVLDAIGNKVITTAEWIANTFNDAVYGVQMAFYTMGTMVLKVVGGIADGIFNTINSALGGISDLINGAIGGVNSFIGLLNGVLDTDLSTIGTVDLKMSNGASNFADKFQNLIDAPTRANKVVLDRMNTAQDYMNSITMPSAPVKKQFERLEYENLGDVYAKGNKAGQSLSMAGSEKLGKLVDKAKNLFGLGEKREKKILLVIKLV